MKELFTTLQERHRPEDVAEMILEKFGVDFTANERAVLAKAAEHSLKNKFRSFTSMMQGFQRPHAPERQVNKALELFKRTESWSAAECAEAVRVRSFINELGATIKMIPGSDDFKSGRLDSEARERAGLDLSRRRYNKLFRFLARFDGKLKTYLHEQKKYELMRVGKSRLIIFLRWEDFESDPHAAAFISYYSARCNLRSVFTNESQQRPYDEIADMLFQHLFRKPERTNWWAVAQIHADRAVLNYLTETQRGMLLGAWLSKLDEIAGLLKQIWDANSFRRNMIVQKGNDSTTWNNTASAWNRARQAWIGLLHSMGMEEELDALCFGKALRLMAADVAAWHRAKGDSLEPDTAVWSELPLPWEVLSGAASCTRQQVEEACLKHNVDPIKKGWIAPPPEKRVEKFQPTPELVHGVAISSAHLAQTLRKAGWFSGKWIAAIPQITGNVAVRRDAHGFAVGADDARN